MTPKLRGVPQLEKWAQKKKTPFSQVESYYHKKHCRSTGFFQENRKIFSRIAGRQKICYTIKKQEKEFLK
jgi:nickel-dependent lactate racemase